MPAPKGHLPYAGCEKGGTLGYLGKPEDAYTKKELIELGKELVNWFFENPMEIIIQDFFAYRGIEKDHVMYLKNKYPEFNKYYKIAKEIQEGRLLKYPFWKKASNKHAEFMLIHHHGYKIVEPEANKQTLPQEILDSLNVLVKNPELIKFVSNPDLIALFNQKQSDDV